VRVRQQLPIATRITARAIARAVVPAALGDDAPNAAVAVRLAGMLGARHVALTDSGTSALVLALRLAVGTGGTVAYPGYGCVDLAAAALFAGVRVRLYDLEPATLSPDLDSLERALARGVDAVLGAHLYGFPVALAEVKALAARHGVVVIEDAAQAAAAALGGEMVGAQGDLGILSFGRGKGLGGAGGGALVARTTEWAYRAELAASRSAPGRRGWRDLASATVQAVVGRPAMYGVPASIPQLHLGEMVYRPAHEPRGISSAAASIVGDALDRAASERALRAEHAARYASQLKHVRDAFAIDPVPSATAGYLRFPIRDFAGREADPRYGILRGYPQALHDQPQLRAVLHEAEPPTPGSIELRSTLFTLPTHRMVSERDHRGIAEWLAPRAARSISAS
jgi:dTDP-4-amino-4,6-dideoxygalactose transaminase